MGRGLALFCQASVCQIFSCFPFVKGRQNPNRRTNNRVPTGRGKLVKVREFEWSGKSGKGQWNFFWKNQANVGENEKLVPPDVRFSG